MKINLNNPNEEVQVQIIPLIDVVFCILVFFILASLQFTRQQSINIDLPQANTATSSVQPDTQREILPVTIDAVGQIYVEKNPVQRQQLGGILKNYLAGNPKGTLVLYASRSATYNDVIEILDLLRQVGGDRVSLAIIPGSEEQPANPLQPIPSLPINPGATPGGVLPFPNTSPLSPNLPQNNPNLNLPPGSTQLPIPTIPNQPQTEQGNSPRVPSGNTRTVPPASAPTAPAPQATVAPAAPSSTNPSP
ncbi:MAG: biopolymer transporter ExbD [Rivularia sp. (in: Bacteria)]|nr:biopolymer transporter ExbD [Rivularia sp. MS3]